jgi:hypothetical protein
MTFVEPKVSDTSIDGGFDLVPGVKVTVWVPTLY